MSTPTIRTQMLNGHVYEVVAASHFEVGLVADGKGWRTWWAQDFDCELPNIDHPKIQQAIADYENFLKEFPNWPKEK